MTALTDQEIEAIALRIAADLSRSGTSSGDGASRVAVTGMGFVTPIGNDLETVWSNLVDGIVPELTAAAMRTSTAPLAAD